MNKKRILLAAITAAVSVGLTLAAAQATAGTHAKKGFEKCAGIVKKGMNDCGTSVHGCAGQSTMDNDPSEWIYLPTGSCKKITGGVVLPKEDKK